MDAGRLTLWLTVALVGSGIVGYAYGFWEVRPAINALTVLGALVLTATVIAATIFVRSYTRARTFRFSLVRLHINRRLGLLWSGAAILVGINAGAFLGFHVGLRTATTVTGALLGVGVVAALAALAAMLVGIIHMVRSRRERNGLR